MKTIPLNPLNLGLVVMVDDDDYEYLSQWHWNAQVQKETAYAVRTTKGPKQKDIKYRMHRVIMNAPDGVFVDHVDGDGLNCRKENMRFCTRAQNQQNKMKVSKNRFKGITEHKPRGAWKKNFPWQARIRVERKLISLGYFATDEEAARAYDAAALKYFGPFAKVNFPS